GILFYRVPQTRSFHLVQRQEESSSVEENPLGEIERLKVVPTKQKVKGTTKGSFTLRRWFRQRQFHFGWFASEERGQIAEQNVNHQDDQQRQKNARQHPAHDRNAH